MRIRITLATAVSCLAVAAVVPSVASAHGTHLKAKMSGDQVVPSGSGAPNGTGVAKLHVLKDKNRLCYDVKWDSIGNSQGLNIGVYKGAEGKNGSEVVPLTTQKHPSPVDGCVDGVSTGDLKAIAKNPHLYHVNIKNKKYPTDGAIRGQLKAV
jgi:hypothetical protein